MGKLLAIVVVVAAIAAIVGLALRPGTVVGVSDDALAESVARASDAKDAGTCSGEDDRRTCSGEGPTWRVMIEDFGCWDATAGRGKGSKPGGAKGSTVSLSGCVTVLDYVGIG